MRPVIVGFSGAEVLTTQAWVCEQIDADEALLQRTTEDGLRELLQAQLHLLRGLRDKLDAAMAFRDTPVAAPF